ncbi:NAD-dependent epimerase/dehydratase family protein [Gammaproteobacteria bacterium LSUCC0057]|uniref:NAD-dependent epimerase/dehydratase family protein n=1 Tax=Gammaproteobacteria bacterium LSUCC0057 TaxID=2559237 RepID=A0A4Y8UJL2_9GAMM|nr:NAD-dependent epimerase/dehydratase family protein [Gammaproteobacteria bacterium LSUCC0057]
MQTAVVIGGAGFIGSHLCRALAAQWRVISLDNYFTGSRDNHVAGVTYIEGDAADVALHVGESVALIVHLGEYSRVEQSLDDIDTVWRLNNNAMMPIMRFATQQGAKLVYSGSSTRFGDGGDTVTQTPYAWLKAKNVELLKQYADWYPLDYAVVYFYNVYGPGEIAEGRYATVVAKFLAMAKRGEPLTVTLPGTQQRTFTHVNDVVAALLLVIAKGHGDGHGIASDDSWSIVQLAQQLSDNIVMTPAVIGNRQTTEIVTSKTRALGWQPRQSLQQYLQANQPQR